MTAVRQVWTGCPYCFSDVHPGPCVLVAHLPGKHNQKDHGHGGGPAGQDDFDTRMANAASGDAAVEMAGVRPTDEFQRSAIDKYAAGGYSDANGALRGSGGNLDQIPPSYHRDIVDGLDGVMADGPPLAGDIVVRRGLVSGRRTFGGRTPGVGTEWTDHGFTSTTAMDRPEKTFTGDDGVEMRILVPKGTRAFSNSHLDPDEIVLDRGLTFRIVRDNGVDPYRGTRQFDVEVIGTRHG